MRWRYRYRDDAVCGGTEVKYLWIYPATKINDMANKWIFYGTKNQYIKWLTLLPSENVKKIVNKSAKFKRIEK